MADAWRQIVEVGQKGTTSKGNPKLNVKTDKGWLNLSHEDESFLAGVKVGCKIRISEPKQYGKSWYAGLQEIEETAPAKQEAKDEGQPAVSGTGIPVIDWLGALKSLHAVISELEPDTETWDRSQARLGMMQTSLIALRDGRINLDSEEIPF